MNRAATLMWYCKTPEGWRRFPAIVINDRGVKRIKVGWVMVDGHQVHYPQGRLQIRQYRGKDKIYSNIEANDPVMGLVEFTRARQRHLTSGKAAENTKLLKNAVKVYVADCRARKAMEAAEQAERVLNEFVQCVAGSYISAIRRDHILTFHKRLRQRGLSDRTIFNYHERVRAFLRFHGVDVKDARILPPAPKYVEGLPEIYTPDQLDAIREAATPEMRMVIDMALKLGLREQELTYGEWSDIDFERKVYRVQEKPRHKFRPKDNEQREITIPADLLEDLKAWREKHPKGRLILGTATDHPNTHLLRTLKRTAKRAGLNCGQCDGCKGELQECGEWYLHRFRATYLTSLLRGGVDARTVQAMAGHSDLTTTLRYLKPAAASEMHDKVSAIEWGR